MDTWDGKLTWDALIAKIESNIGCRYTRQALDRHARIKLAYQTTKERLAEQPRARLLTKVQAQKRIDDYERLVAENMRLQKENDSLLEQFVRWAYNATLHGLSEELLDAPLPKVNRRQTPQEVK